MSQSGPSIENIGQYNQHFNKNVPEIKNEPRTDRECNDKCCYVVFVILTLLLIGGGLFFMIKADFSKFSELSQAKMSSTPSLLKNSTSNSTSGQIDTYDIQNLKPGIPVIVGMVALSVVLAVAFQCLLIKFPQCMFYAMLILGGIFMIALAIIMIIAGGIAGGIVFGVITIIYFVVIFCNKNQIRIGTVLLETASRFILEKPSVFMVPFIMLFIVLLFQVFWLASLISISLYTGGAKNQQEIDSQQTMTSIFVMIWMFLQLFYSFFFQYCTVFLMATAAAFWYYNVSSNFICTGFKRIIANHLGSFTFAALIMAIVSSARQNAQDRSRNNQGCMAVCMCCLVCCLRGLEDLLQVLNHNAVIVMAVTGQSYIDSAKSTISLIYENFPLFLIIDVVSGFLKLGGVLFICGIPGIAGYFLLQAISPNPDDSTFMTFGTIIIVLISMIIAVIFLNVLSEALSCVFIFFCLDKKLMNFGYPAPHNVPPTMRRLFEELSNSAKSIQGESNHQTSPNPYGSSNLNQNNQPRQPSYNPSNPSRNSGYPSLN